MKLFRKLVCLVATTCSLCATADDSFATAITNFGAVRNNLEGLGGFRLINQSGFPLTITHLGRWKLPGNTQVHELSVIDYLTGTVLATTTVDMSGPEPANAFVYGSISPVGPIWGNGLVYIMSSETAGGDTWYSGTSTPPALPTLIAPTLLSNIVAAYRDDGYDGLLKAPGVAWSSFGPLDFKVAAPLSSWTKEGTTYTTDGAQYSVASAIYDSSAGDTITIPPGTVTWGDDGAYLLLSKPVTVMGAGSGSTTIVMSAGAPGGNGSGLVRYMAGATFGGVTITTPAGSTNTVFSQNTSTVHGFRMTDVVLVGGVGSGNPVWYNNLNPTTYTGVIDHVTTTTGVPVEQIFVRGPSNAWDTDGGAGSGSGLYIENCTFNGPLNGNAGYVCDGNANSSLVFRFCTINGRSKLDGHGLASNSPPASCRMMEAYHLHWTETTGTWAAFEPRGGSGYFFNNTADASSGANNSWLFLTDYGYTGQWPNFGSVFQTPANSPLGYQIGTGQRIPLNVTAITQYQMVQILTMGDTDFAAIGAPSVHGVGTQFVATGPGTGSGTVTTTPASQPFYLWGNTKGGSPWARTLKPINSVSLNTDTAGYAIGSTVITTITPPGSNTVRGKGTYLTFAGDSTYYRLTADRTNASPTFQITPALVVALPASAVTATMGLNTQFRGQTANPSVTLTEADMIRKNEHFFADSGFDGTFTFNGSQGIGRGTKEEMEEFDDPEVNGVGVGFWVTDEGNWNTENLIPDTPGYGKGQGQLYTWSGSAWALKYTPYTYPHPLAVDAEVSPPLLVSASINEEGTTLVLVFNESVTFGAGGNSGWTVALSGGAATLTYAAGSGTDTLTYNLSRTVDYDETGPCAYTQPGSGVEDSSGTDLVTISSAAVTNGSTHSEPEPEPLPAPRASSSRRVLVGGY